MRTFLVLLALGQLFPFAAMAAAPPEFQSCAPSSEALIDEASGVDQLFCSDWNMEYGSNGSRCCTQIPRKRKGRSCLPSRRKANFCDERTPEQKAYEEAFTSGKLGDILTEITDSVARRANQAYCGVNNGFLAFGRPVLGTAENRIAIKAPHRCTNFGTDGMAGMLEWLGRQVRQKYAEAPYEKVKLVVGDISAPKGGCLSGPSGRRGHASHTSGQDADVGFLNVLPGKESPILFNKDFDPAVSWWLVKNIFKNPYACVKVVFLDRRMIAKLGKAARGDEDWGKYRRFLRHVRGHRNHFHIRVGNHPGLPGCTPDAHPELEDEEDPVDLEDPSSGEVPSPDEARSRPSEPVGLGASEAQPQG